MAAVTVSVACNHKTRTIVYSFSGEAYFDLITGAGEGTKLLKNTTLDNSKFAFYKPALSGTYAAPAAGNVYDDVTIESVVFASDGKSLTIKYLGDFAAIDPAAFGYTCYPILYKLYAADNTDSSANHIQACYQTPKEITISSGTIWNSEIELTASAISTTGGAMITPTYRDEKLLLVFINGDSSNAETVTVYEGEGLQSIGQSTSFSIAASGKSALVLESGRYKHFYHTLLKGKYYITGTADVSVIAIQLP